MKALGVRHIASYLDSSRDINDVISNKFKIQEIMQNANLLGSIIIFISEIISTEKYSKRFVSEIFSKIPN